MASLLLGTPSTSPDCSFSRLFLSPEDQLLFGVVVNYLRLSEFDHARTMIHELFSLVPLRVLRVLRTMFLRQYPTEWVIERVVPSFTLVAWFCADEYERLWKYVQKEVIADATHPLNQKEYMTKVNMLGFVEYDLLTVEVLDGVDLPVQEGFATAVIIACGAEKFQTSFSRKPDASNPEFLGFYSVADNSNRLHANEFSPLFVDEELKILIVQNQIDPINDRLQQGNVATPLPIACTTIPLEKLRNKEDYYLVCDLKKMVGGCEDNASGGKLVIFLKWSNSQKHCCGQVPEKIRFRLRADHLLSEVLDVQGKLERNFLGHDTIREMRQKLRMSSDDFCLSISSEYSAIGLAALTPLTNKYSKTVVRKADLKDPKNKHVYIGEAFPEFINKLRPLIPIEPYRINDVLLEEFICYPEPDAIFPRLLPAVQAEHLHVISQILLTDLRNICTGLPHLGFPLAVILSQHWHAIIIGHPHANLDKPQFVDQSYHRIRTLKLADVVVIDTSDSGSVFYRDADHFPPQILALKKIRKRLWDDYNIALKHLFCALVCESLLLQKWDALHLATGSMLSLLYILFEQLSMSTNDKETTFTESPAVIALFFIFAQAIYRKTIPASDVMNLIQLHGSLQTVYLEKKIQENADVAVSKPLFVSPDLSNVLLLVSYYLRHFPSGLSYSDDVSGGVNESVIEHFVASFPGLGLTANGDILGSLIAVIDQMIRAETANHIPATNEPVQISSITPCIPQTMTITDIPLLATVARKLQLFTACFSSLSPHSEMFSTSVRSLSEALSLFDSQILVVHLMNRILPDNGDFLPFFFHRFELELNSFERTWNSHTYSQLQLIEKLNYSRKAFLMEYYAFCRYADFSFYDFVVSNAISFCMENKFDRANTVLLPFPFLRSYVVIVCFHRFTDFADKYNLVMYLWRHSKFFSKKSPQSAQIVDAYLSTFDSLGDPHFVLWANRLNFYAEMLEALVVIPADADEEERYALESKKNDLANRLSHSIEGSWPFVLHEEGVLNFDPNALVQLFEPAPYYNNLGVFANHDMRFLQILYAIRLLFGLIASSPAVNETKFCGPIFELIEHIVLVSLRGESLYQLNCIEKLIAVALMRRYAVEKRDGENPLLIPARRLSPVMDFLKKISTLAYEGIDNIRSAPREILEIARKFSLYAERIGDVSWRLAILRGAVDIQGLYYLFVLTSPANNLPIVLFRRSFNFGGADAQYKYIENHYRSQTENSDEVWFKDRAAFLGAENSLEQNLKLISLPMGFSGFIHAFDLLVSSLDDSLFAFTKVDHAEVGSNTRLHETSSFGIALFEISKSLKATKLILRTDHQAQSFYLSLVDHFQGLRGNSYKLALRLLGDSVNFLESNAPEGPNSNQYVPSFVPKMLDYAFLLRETIAAVQAGSVVWALRPELDIVCDGLQQLVNASTNLKFASLTFLLSKYTPQSVSYKSLLNLEANINELHSHSVEKQAFTFPLSSFSHFFPDPISIEGNAVDVSGIALPWILEFNRDRLYSIQKLVAPIYALFHVLLNKKLTPLLLQNFRSSISSVLNDLQSALPELRKWVESRFSYFDLIASILHDYPLIEVYSQGELEIISELVLHQSEISDQLAITRLARLVLTQDSSEETLLRMLKLLDTCTDASCEDAQILTEELINSLLIVSCMSSNQRMHYILRMKDLSRAGNYLMQFVGDVTEVDPLNILILKLLSAPYPKFEYSMPPYLSDLQHVKEWPPSDFLSTQLMAFLEYTQNFLSLYVAIRAAVPLSVKAYGNWRLFEKALDENFVPVCISLFYDFLIPSQLASRLFDLYSSIRAKTAILQPYIPSVIYKTLECTENAGNLVSFKVKDEVQEWLSLNSILEMLNCSHFNPHLDPSPAFSDYKAATYHNKLNVLRRLEVILQLYPRRLFPICVLLVKRLYHASSRLMILEFLRIHTNLEANKIVKHKGKDVHLVQIGADEQQWILNCHASISMVLKFPVELQLQFVKDYDKPGHFMYLMLERHLSIGSTELKDNPCRWEKYWQYLMDILNNPDYKAYIFQTSHVSLESSVHAATLHSFVGGEICEGSYTMPHLILVLIRDLLCGQSGDKFSSLASRKKPALDMLNACPSVPVTDLAVLSIVNDLSRLVSNVNIPHGAMNRFLILELLHWLAPKLSTWPMEIRIQYFGSSEIIASTNSLLYRIYGFGVDVAIRDLMDPKLAIVLRKRLLGLDKIDLVHRVMLEVEGLTEQDFLDYMTKMREEADTFTF